MHVHISQGGGRSSLHYSVMVGLGHLGQYQCTLKTQRQVHLNLYQEAKVMYVTTTV